MYAYGENNGESIYWQSCLGTAKFWTESVDYGYDDISYMLRPGKHLKQDTGIPYISMENTNTEDLISIIFNEKNRS